MSGAVDCAFGVVGDSCESHSISESVVAVLPENVRNIYLHSSTCTEKCDRSYRGMHKWSRKRVTFSIGGLLEIAMREVRIRTRSGQLQDDEQG